MGIIADPEYYERHPEGRSDAALAMLLLDTARSITTAEGPLLQHIDSLWYAYPKLDDREGSTGGKAIMDNSQRLVKFPSAIEAYQACVVTKERIEGKRL
jgi:hypothetical protein